MAAGPRLVTDLRGPPGPDDTSRKGVVVITTTKNNTYVMLTDLNSQPKASESAGSMGYKNAAKRQPVAAERAAAEVAARGLKMGIESVVVKFRGIGRNKQIALSALHAAGLRITQLMDVTPIPYNGCRPKKKRRV